jgi:hypothetical protein
LSLAIYLKVFLEKRLKKLRATVYRGFINLITAHKSQSLMDSDFKFKVVTMLPEKFPTAAIALRFWLGSTAELERYPDSLR